MFSERDARGVRFNEWGAYMARIFPVTTEFFVPGDRLTFSAHSRSKHATLPSRRSALSPTVADAVRRKRHLNQAAEHLALNRGPPSFLIGAARFMRLSAPP